MALDGILQQFLEHEKDVEVYESCEKAIQAFIKNNNQTFTLTEFPLSTYRTMINNLFICFTKKYFQNSCLKILCILSRDESVANSKEFVKNLNIFMDLLKSPTEIADIKIAISKVICNLAYHSADVRTFLIDNEFSLYLITNIKICDDLLSEQTYFNVRLLFIISALICDECAVMMENNILNVLLEIAEQALQFDVLVDKTYKALSEIMKTLFNITRTHKTGHADEFERLVILLRALILKYSPFGNDDLLTHLGHLLLNVPADSLKFLYHKADNVVPEEYLFEGNNMEVMHKLLNQLDSDIQIQNYTAMCSKSLPILTMFSYVCRLNSIIRKYVKEVVLPKRDVSDKRPEESNDLRGRMISLLRTVDVPLKNMAADFLFVLCKENQSRLIYYTGYGNCAGYLTTRGLMAPGLRETEGIYSDDDESDQKEFNSVDYITGAAKTEPDANSILENMTEEEKEAEAEKLMVLFNRLQDHNVIKPVGLDADGKIVELPNK